MNLFLDRVHRLPRIWSNDELKKFAHLFAGDVVNVSAWRDEDKQGKTYRDYFKQAHSYSLTNYYAEANGLQGFQDEIFLDLEAPLDPQLERKFDVVFNHTTLEHIYDFRTAFNNLCMMSRDIVIIVVPFVQQYHAHYGDFWRFSPEAIPRMFNENEFQVVYQSFNNQPGTSVYLFSIATRNPNNWIDHFGDWKLNLVDDRPTRQEPFAGSHVIPNRRHRITLAVKEYAKSLLRVLRIR